MNDLPQPAIEHLYPVLVIIALVITTFVALLGGLWVGFRWLNDRIEEAATRMLAPVIERVAVLEKAVDAAHRRIDEWLGARK